jgi:hypothetical protein
MDAKAAQGAPEEAPEAAPEEASEAQGAPQEANKGVQDAPVASDDKPYGEYRGDELDEFHADVIHAVMPGGGYDEDDGEADIMTFILSMDGMPSEDVGKLVELVDSKYTLLNDAIGGQNLDIHERTTDEGQLG